MNKESFDPLNAKIPHATEEYIELFSNELSVEFRNIPTLMDIIEFTNIKQKSTSALIKEIENEVQKHGDLVLTFYVDNPNLRKIFDGREEFSNPLPMICVPHFRQEGPNKETGFKAISVPDDEFELSISPREKELNYVLFQGIGGDFIGYHEKKQYRRFLMPVFEREIVPTYRKGFFALVSFLSPNVNLIPYPKKKNSLTYKFSAPFSIYENYGLELIGPGTEFVLKIGEKESQVMNGKAILYFSKRIDRKTPLIDVIKYDVWFAKFVYLLNRLIKEGKPNIP